MALDAPNDSISDVMALYLARRDEALGLPRPGQRALAVYAYRVRQVRETLDHVAQAAFYQAFINEARTEIKRCVREADTPEKRREALPVVTRLNKLVEQAAGKLEAF